MVDEVRVERLLRAIADDVGVLREEAAADEKRRSDAMWLRGVKYAFVTAIEGAVDIAQHLCAAKGWGPPADNGDAIRILADKAVVPAANADAMRRAVGFRNVLVHEYVAVRDDIVVDRLADLRDLDDYVRNVAAYLGRASS